MLIEENLYENSDELWILNEMHLKAWTIQKKDL